MTQLEFLKRYPSLPFYLFLNNSAIYADNLPNQVASCSFTTLLHEKNGRHENRCTYCFTNKQINLFLFVFDGVKTANT